MRGFRTYGWLVVWVWLVPAMGATRELAIDEALQRIDTQSPQLRAARARAMAADATRKSIRGRLLPSLYVSDEQQRYQDPFTIAFPSPSGAVGPALVARDLSTNTLVVAATQPVLGLLHLTQDYAAASDGATASALTAQAAVADAHAALRTAFLRLFEARALADTAAASERTLKDQVQMARTQVDAGVLTHADVLRLDVAAANAKQLEITAVGQERSLRAEVLELVGLGPDDGSITFREPTALLEPAKAPVDLQVAREQALKARPELASAESQAAAARHRASAKLLSLLPEVNLEAGYMHIKGQAFAPPDAAYVGIKAEWMVWEWGTRYYEHDVAAAQADAAQADADDLRRRVSIEVAARRADADAMVSAVEVAQIALTSAEEAYRVTQALAQAGSATTTDLLDAEAALTRARLNLVRARYESAIARVALARVTGIE